MNLRLKEVKINSKNTNFKHFITKKILFLPLIGNIRLSILISTLFRVYLWYSFVVDGIFSGLVV